MLVATMQVAGHIRAHRMPKNVAIMVGAGGASFALLVAYLAVRRGRTMMSTFRVHMHLAKVGMTEECKTLFRDLLDTNSIKLTFGETMPEGTEVLISNMPKDEFYDSPGLKAVILPYAGPHPAVVSKIRDLHPHLTLHNLHSNAVSTAEMAMSLLLATAKLLVPADKMLREGDWTPGGGLALSAADLSFAPSHQVILEGKRALILGLGAVGGRIATACQALGMEAHGIRRSTSRTHVRGDGVRVHPPSSLHSLLPSITALIVCMPSTPETRGLLGPTELELLPREAVVVNVGRGDIIDEEALYRVLVEKKIHGAGLDVWWQYPHKDSPPGHREHPSKLDFHLLENVVMSPHRGGAPGLKESEERRFRALAVMLNQAAREGGVHAMPNRVPLHRGY